ncbi:unnamed protein product [Caenorhabditis sp. 36 PRJEB53466]|nr:unnamed protein product [Caenorhabditis sp. 36 PRJEB53466]
MPSKSLKLSSRPAFARRIPSEDSSRACVSTYLLDPSSDSRSGSLCIVKIHESGGLQLENEISTSAGVFRFDFRNPSTVVAALTDGSLVVQKIEDAISSETTPVSSDMLLDLGLSDSSLSITSDNKGNAYIVDLNTSLIVSTWFAHSLPYVPGEGCEVWSCAITGDAQTVVTGGEDGSMKLWDARTRTSIGQSKAFGAGVVFVDFPSDSNQILTGSYDEHVRIFDRRNLKEATAEKKLTGGVWNIEQTGSQFCVACMYGGYALLDSNTLEIVHQNRDSGANLLYGATKMSERSVLFCTFNDYLIVLDELKL